MRLPVSATGDFGSDMLNRGREYTTAFRSIREACDVCDCSAQGKELSTQEFGLLPYTAVTLSVVQHFEIGS